MIYFSVEFYKINVEEFLLPTHAHARTHRHAHTHLVFLCYNSTTLGSCIMTKPLFHPRVDKVCRSMKYWLLWTLPFICSLYRLNINEREENHYASCLNMMKAKRNTFEKWTLFIKKKNKKHQVYLLGYDLLARHIKLQILKMFYRIIHNWHQYWRIYDFVINQ